MYKSNNEEDPCTKEEYKIEAVSSHKIVRMASWSQ